MDEEDLVGAGRDVIAGPACADVAVEDEVIAKACRSLLYLMKSRVNMGPLRFA